MLPSNGRPTKTKYEYYITDDEVIALLRDVKRYCTDHWQIYTNILLFVGIRSQEALALNITDFPGWKNLDFSKVYVRLEKTNEIQERHVIEPIAAHIREYIIKYDGQFPAGYLFPSKWQTRCKRPYMNSETAGAWFAKVRQRLGKIVPGFNEFYAEVGKYRIHPHTLRHWYETRVAKIESDPYFLVKLMGYKEISTVMSYVRVENFKDRAPKVLAKTFLPVLDRMNSYCPGQTTLNSVFNANKL